MGSILRYLLLLLLYLQVSEDSYAAGRELYEQLCRGEITAPIEITSKLVCYYENNGKNPFLLFAPFKVEEAYTQPRIVIFHDVIADREIATIKKLAQPRVSCCFFYNST